MSEYGDPGSMDPYHLLNVYLPDEATITARVTVAAAIRNPDMSYREIVEFADTTDTTVRRALTAFYYGALDSVKVGHGDDRRYRNPEDRTTIDEFTDKQQTVIEFFARYPEVKEHVEKPKADRAEDEWSWTDVRAYIAAHTGISSGSEYIAAIARDYWEFIEQRREYLQGGGALDGLPDVPEKADEIPRKTRPLLEGQISSDALPDENLDADHYNGEDGWMEPYASVDLDDVDETDLPHYERTEEEVAADMVEARSERVSIDSGNASYDGPATGLDTTSGEGTQTIGEAPAYGSDDDPDEKEDAPLPRSMCGGCGRVELMPGGKDCPGNLCGGTMEYVDDAPGENDDGDEMIDGEQVADWLEDAPDGDGEAAADAIRGDDEDTHLVAANVPQSLYEQISDAAMEEGTSPGRELVRLATSPYVRMEAGGPTNTTDPDPDGTEPILAALSRIEDAANLARAERKRNKSPAVAGRLTALEWAQDVLNDEAPGQNDD